MTICLLLGVHASDESIEDKSSQHKLLCPFELLGMPSPGGITGAYHYANMQRLELQLTKRGILPITYEKTKPYPVRISVEVEAQSSTRLSMTDLPNVNAFHVSRLKEDAVLYFGKRWAQLGGDMEIFQSATTRPEVFKALRKRAAYQHIKMFIYPAWVNGEVITMATYFGEEQDVTIAPHQ